MRKNDQIIQKLWTLIEEISHRPEKYCHLSITWNNNMVVGAVNSIIVDSERSLHSEVASLHKTRNTKEALTMLNLRLSSSDCRAALKTGIIPVSKLAEPCYACAKVLQSVNVTTYYSSANGDIFKFSTGNTSRGKMTRRDRNLSKRTRS